MSTFPVCCPHCQQQSYVTLLEATDPAYLICGYCGGETAQLFCPDCEIGWEFIDDIQTHPMTWTCPECKNPHPLPSDFYRNPQLTNIDPLDDSDFMYAENITLFNDKNNDLFGLTGLLVGLQIMLSCLTASAINTQAFWWGPLILLLLSGGWSLFVGIVHKPQQLVYPLTVTEADTRRKLYYQSGWSYLYRGGQFAIFAALIGWHALLLILYPPPVDPASWRQFAPVLPAFFLILAGVLPLIIAAIRFLRRGWHHLQKSQIPGT